MNFNDEEKEAIRMSLLYWANYIQTGDINLSAQDAQSMKKSFNALSDSQMEKVLFLKKLAQKVCPHGEMVS